MVEKIFFVAVFDELIQAELAGIVGPEDGPDRLLRGGVKNVLFRVFVPEVAEGGAGAGTLFLLEGLVFVGGTDFVAEFAGKMYGKEILDVVLKLLGVMGAAVKHFLAAVIVDGYAMVFAEFIKLVLVMPVTARTIGGFEDQNIFYNSQPEA